MATRDELTLNSAFNTFSLATMMNDRSYKPATLRNRLTGQRQEVILIDTQAEIIENRILRDSRHNYELHADLTAAFKSFSPIEKRIILRVLYQGQSVREATKTMGKSARHWERWMNEKALPILRTVLSDYEPELRKLGLELPSELPDDTEPVEEQITAKCRFCDVIVSAKAKLLPRTLRSHVSKAHAEEARKALAFVRENDDVIRHDALTVKEPKLQADEGWDRTHDAL